MPRRVAESLVSNDPRIAIFEPPVLQLIDIILPRLNGIRGDVRFRIQRSQEKCEHERVCGNSWEHDLPTC